MLSTLYIRLLPPIYQGRMSVPLAVRSPIQGTEGCAGATAVRFTPLHAGARFWRSVNPRYGRLCRSTVFRSMPELMKQHGIPLCSCRCSGTYRLLSVSFLSGPTAAWANGNTSRFAPACIYSGRSQGGKSPLAVCPADQYFSPAQAVAPVISSFPSAFIPGRAVRTVIIGATLCFLRMLSGSHRSGFTAANIGRRACPLRFEVHFLQILP